jgi:hypothetical protein
MAEFSTVHYDDIEYNKGEWQVRIMSAERTALFDGYRLGGGVIHTERLNVWMNYNKLGGAVFLYWRIHEAGRKANAKQIAQYQLDLDNLFLSLERNLPN